MLDLEIVLVIRTPGALLVRPTEVINTEVVFEVSEPDGKVRIPRYLLRLW